MEFIIGLVILGTILSIEIQLSKLNKTNEKIVELLKEIKNNQFR